MRNLKLSLRSSSLPALAAALLLSGTAPGVAHATESAEEGVAEEALVQDSVADEDPASEDSQPIVVTGSRIALDNVTSAASPITVVTGEQILTSGQADVGTLLRSIPALQGTLPGIDSVNQDEPGAGAGDSSDLGLSVLNLRNLGSVRTLVLVDGRRHVPGTGGSAAVDINHIPQARIKSVDVFTGGASSVYGADAVTGVVNFNLRTGRDFDGIEYNFQGGISDRGDAESFTGSIAWGGEFADGRGSAVISAEYRKQASLIAADRPFAGKGQFSLSAASQRTLDLLGITQDQLRLPAGTIPANAFVPDYTLPISSGYGIIAIDRSAFVAGRNAGRAGVTANIPGTNIPTAQVLDNGVLRAFNPGVSVGGFDSSGGDGIGANPLGIILPDLDQVVVSGGADYEVTPGITAFVEGTFAFTSGRDQAGIPFNDEIPIRLDNPFIPAALRTQIDTVRAAGRPINLNLQRDLLDADVQPFEDTERTTWRVVGGFKGEFDELGWNWEVSYNYGRTEVESTFRNTRIEDRYFYAIDAVALTAQNIGSFRPSSATKAIRNGQDITINASSAQIGDIICRSQLDGSAPGVSPFPEPPTNPDGTGKALTFNPGDGQCAPINIFGLNSIKGAGADFAFLDIIDSTVITQQQFLASLSGDSAKFFELPGGPLGFAAGFEYRKDTSQYTPSTLRYAPAITSGAVNSGPTRPSPDPSFPNPDISVYEVFGELRAPILADLRFIDLLEVQGAIRYSDYNTIGKTLAWSAGGRYKPIDSLTFRGTYSVAVRAPNLAELFGPLTPATLGLTADPCSVVNISAGSSFRKANCDALVGPNFDPTNFASAFRPGTSGGNPNLSEEEAKTFTAGFVFEPTFVPGLTLIADYYDIKITGAIGSLTGAEIAAACVDLPTTNNQFCAQIDRDPTTKVISFFRSGLVNLGALNVKGVDFAATYRFDLADVIGSDAGSLSLSATGTRFIKDEQVFDATADVLIAAITDPLERERARISNRITNDNLGTLGNPEWIANFGITWNYDKLTLGWTGRFESSQLSPGIDNIEVKDVVIENGAVVVKDDDTFVPRPQRDTGSSLVSDFFGSYDFSEAFGIYGGINNAFDREPYLGSLVRPIGVRGRYFYLGVQGKF
ncbi:TonB-dependent receptor domain-containing protein [Erythrobacter sp. NE805]|uniref:TonB-dependent receptor domain-containing protein n=1 Tax=Erythrobacter sp. NE805 TaxID=3389875 RepID=UPI00396B1B42